MNRHGGHIGHMTLTVFSQPKEALYGIFVTICPVVSEEIFKKCQV